jgi:hypothetical protein
VTTGVQRRPDVTQVSLWPSVITGAGRSSVETKGLKMEVGLDLAVNVTF